MDKKYALILAFMITGLVACEFYLYSGAHETSRERVFVSRVIDGDTLKLSDNRTIRLLNINTPEKNSIIYPLSTDLTKALENQTIEIEITGMDMYKRYLSRVYTPEYLNLEIVKEGRGSKFLVQESELGAFAEAEKYAIENSLGIWKKSQFYGCIKSKIDQHNEIVTLINVCHDINVKDWEMKDESRKIYKFANLSLGEVNIHSSNGTDNSTDLFWNQKTAVWNDDRDTMYLFDEKGSIVHAHPYGY